MNAHLKSEGRKKKGSFKKREKEQVQWIENSCKYGN